MILEINRLNKYGEIFILGDFNINYKGTNNPDTKILKWFEQKSGLKQIIDETTRFSNTNSCIDLIFTNSPCIFDQGTLDVNISDHEMIFVTRKHMAKTKNPSSFKGRSYRNYNENMFIQQLNDIDWHAFYQCISPDIAWSIMENNIMAKIDTMCPTQTFHVKHLKDPWISQELLEAIKDKDRLLSKAKRTNNENDCIIARSRRNEVKKIVKNAKADFIKEHLEQYKNDSKKFWKTLRDVVPSSKNTNSNKILLKDSNGTLITNPKEMADEMNAFFTSIGPNLARDIRTPWVYSGLNVENNIADFHTNNDEVLKYIKEININKSSAIPLLSSKILKLYCLTN